MYVGIYRVLAASRYGRIGGNVDKDECGGVGRARWCAAGEFPGARGTAGIPDFFPDVIYFHRN